LHLFSASADLVGFCRAAYRRRSEETSLLLGRLFERLREEGLAVAFTMEDFKRQFVKEHFPRLRPEERLEVLRSLPPEELLGALSMEQIRAYLDRLTAGRPARPAAPEEVTARLPDGRAVVRRLADRGVAPEPMQ
jgi:hypothetical protein